MQIVMPAMMIPVVMAAVRVTVVPTMVIISGGRRRGETANAEHQREHSQK
jgi:hypothetical protein